MTILLIALVLLVKNMLSKKKYISSEFVEKNKLSESQILGPLCKAHSQENKQRKSGIRFMLKVKLKKCLFSKSFSKNQIGKKVLPIFMHEIKTSVYFPEY